MDEIKIYKEINAKDPALIAGWPGMGNVASGVVEYLIKTLKPVKFAEIKLDPSVSLDSVVVDDGLASLPKPPENNFYYSKEHNIIIFEADAQMPGPSGAALVGKVLDLAERYGVKKIFTGAAFPMPVSFKEPSEVYGAANKKSLLVDSLVKFGVNLMESGHISGLNGLIIGLAAKRNIEAVCLLATMPQYSISLPNPRASFAIIETLRRMLSFEVDLTGLEKNIRQMDEQMAIIEERVKDVFSLEKEEPKPKPPPAKKSIPGYVMERIERLFREAKTDKAKAMFLKKELDRWDMYKMYEDRFLDLFKENQ